MSTATNADFPGGVEWYTYTRPDGEEERECQCARCGSSLYDESCWECGGAGEVEDNRDWTLGGLVESWMTCRGCNGRGSHFACASGSVWCRNNPLPGRENVEGA